ncbi:MAG TPA: DUF2231 domain-containing protein [Gemmatimonadales bacterium]|nr:DUF2231 domain-containing protein [Gemmatimonadales bacterium]
MDIGAWHPQVVHFVVALLFVGVGARLLSLLPLPERARFIGPAATVLILMGTIASLLAVKSGDDAHGPAERVPGAREAVVEHEEWGERTRNVFLIVAALELAAIALSAKRREQLAKQARVAAAIAGLAGLWVLYEAAEHGGEVVYSYAGGVGLRSGDTADVRRLLVAGLYHNAMLERRAGRGAEAYALFRELERREPGTVTLLLRIESQLRDVRDSVGALETLRAWTPPADEPRVRMRHALLLAEALHLNGHADSARAIVERLRRDFPESQAVAELARRVGL